MSEFLFLVGGALGALAFLFCLILFHSVGNLDNKIFLLKKKIQELEALLAQKASQPQESSEPYAQEQAEQKTPAVCAAAVSQPAAPAEQTPVPSPIPTPVSEPLPSQEPSAPAAASVSAQQDVPSQEPLAAPACPVQACEATQEETPSSSSKEEASNWTIVQLLSWVGGFTLLVAAGFWIKYAIENDLLSPAARMMLSAAVGVILLAAGLFIKKETLKTTADTFCGVGLTVLYISVYGAQVFYQLIAPSAAFGLMAGISLASFAVAVWKRTKYVGFLAEIISFLTPFLLSFDHWNLTVFFTYMAFINVAAGAAALARQWDSLLVGAAVFTFLGQLAAYSQSGGSAQPGVFCVFGAIYASAAALAAWKYTARLQVYCRNALGLFVAGNLLFVLWGMLEGKLTFAGSFYLLALGLWLNLTLVYLTCRDEKMYTWVWRVGKVFLFLALWTWTDTFSQHIKPLLMLGTFLAFAAINGGADLYLYRRQNRQPGLWGVLFPVMLMLPLVKVIAGGGFWEISLLLTALLTISLLLALAAKRPLSGLCAVVLFVVALAAVGPETAWGMDGAAWVLLLGLVPVALLFAVVRWIFPSQFSQANSTIFVSAIMPYVLALSALGGVQDNWSLLLGYVLILNLLSIFLAYIYKNGKILPAALAGSTLLQLVVYGGMEQSFAGAFIGWTLGLNAVFAAGAFVFKQRFIEDKSAWVAASLAGVAAFFLTSLTLHHYYEIDYSWTAIAFALIYGAITYEAASWQPVEQGIQRARLAWLGGVTLLFITAFFPMHFHMQWLSVSWALEGAALVWLCRRLQFRGLALTGFWLLVTSFFLVFLGTNFALQGDSSLFNRFLYVFGLVGASLLWAAGQWSLNEEKVFASWLKALGGIVFFALLNVEIAVYFSQGAGTLQFDMFGSFDSAIAYTLGWTVFGSICLFLGFGKKGGYVAPVGLIIICFSLLKLFFSDIWALGGLYRVCGLVGVALVLIGVSFLFQMLQKK